MFRLRNSTYKPLPADAQAARAHLLKLKAALSARQSKPLNS